MQTLLDVSVPWVPEVIFPLEEGNYASKPQPRGAKYREEKITSGRTNTESHFRL